MIFPRREFSLGGKENAKEENKNLPTITEPSVDNNQKKITDLIREYNSYVRKHVITSTIFNKKTMDSKDFIVTSERTSEAFNTGKDDKINIMGD